jgi:hypothetical protein
VLCVGHPAHLAVHFGVEVAQLLELQFRVALRQRDRRRRDRLDTAAVDAPQKHHRLRKVAASRCVHFLRPRGRRQVAVAELREGDDRLQVNRGHRAVTFRCEHRVDRRLRAAAARVFELEVARSVVLHDDRVIAVFRRRERRTRVVGSRAVVNRLGAVRRNDRDLDGTARGDVVAGERRAAESVGRRERDAASEGDRLDEGCARPRDVQRRSAAAAVARHVGLVVLVVVVVVGIADPGPARR